MRAILLRGFLPLALLLSIGSFAPEEAASGEADKDLVKRGQYLFAIAGGCACHTIPEGTPHAGGRAFPIPFGKVYSTNITQDRETGLGAWSDQEIRDSLVKGKRPNGQKILPVMPYEAYAGMSEEDQNALVAYLRTLKPVKKKNPAAELKLPFYRPFGTRVWLALFGNFSEPPKIVPESGVARGRYLVDHVALCGDCHTPRNWLGAPKKKLYLAGNPNGPFGEEVSNITPDKETGIGEWSREDIAGLIRTGTKPDLDNAQGLMAEVIEGTPLGYKDMQREDALAIADYLKTIPPIKNKIK